MSGRCLAGMVRIVGRRRALRLVEGIAGEAIQRRRSAVPVTGDTAAHPAVGVAGEPAQQLRQHLASESP